MYFDVEVMKVKLEQMEKRIDLLEKMLSFFDRAQKAENAAAAYTQVRQQTNASLTDDTSSTSVDSEEASEPLSPPTPKKQTSYMRRIV